MQTVFSSMNRSIANIWFYQNVKFNENCEKYTSFSVWRSESTMQMNPNSKTRFQYILIKLVETIIKEKHSDILAFTRSAYSYLIYSGPNDISVDKHMTRSSWPKGQWLRRIELLIKFRNELMLRTGYDQILFAASALYMQFSSPFVLIQRWWYAWMIFSKQSSSDCLIFVLLSIAPTDIFEPINWT